MIYGPLDHLRIVHAHIGLDGMTIAGRGLDHRDVAYAGHGHLQGARNGGSRQRKHIHLQLQPPEGLFLRHTETLLLVYDDQSQVLGLHVLREKSMRADDHVKASGFKLPQHRFLLGGAPEAR